MFKCSECGAEYEVKPKYCECGNNIFYETGKEIDDAGIDDVETDNFIQNNVPEEKFSSSARRSRKKPETFSPLAIGTFSLCIILSLIILLFIGNPKKTTVKKDTQTQKIAQSVNIPSVDSYWDNTSAKTASTGAPVQNKPAAPESAQNAVKQIIPPVTKSIPEPKAKTAPAKISKTILNQPHPKKPTANSHKPESAANKHSGAKTAQTNQKNTPQNSSFSALTNKIRNQYSGNSVSSSVTGSSQKPAAKVNKPAPTPQKTSSTASTAQIHKPQTSSQTVKSPAQQTKSSAQLKQELSSYKAGLRNTIGRKVDFTKVIGDGDCSLSFKINSNGKLYSKSFTKQSSNMTLNDAAFNALNTTTSYNPPPDGYKGEALRLNIRFYNGNFEISLN